MYEMKSVLKVAVGLLLRIAASPECVGADLQVGTNSRPIEWSPVGVTRSGDIVARGSGQTEVDLRDWSHK